ncbi:hypothetical protein CASFOL_007895 [Castilleja foliolosa]|uniref:Small ribosomal subunit protein uS4c n=1 Tax=Castilleja foliolosa TaxID=1961234 RepID=A0ABD3E1Y4_9LAMI
MSRYRGPRFKKIRRLGALPGLTNKRPKVGTDLRNQSRSGKKSQYRIRLEEKQKLRFHYGLTERHDHEIEFQLFVERYQLVEPLIKERNAVYESLTYSSELYVSAGLIWKTSRDMQEQTILIGNIPLMNSLAGKGGKRILNLK